MEQETRNRQLERERLQARPAPDEVELEPGDRDGLYVGLAALVSVLAGLFTLITPWLKDFVAGDNRGATIVGAIVVLVAAAGRVAAPQLTRIGWTLLTIAAGVWLVGAAFSTQTSGAGLADAACGIGVIVIALLTMDAADRDW